MSDRYTPIEGELLPSNATPLERRLATVTAQATNIPVPIRALWNVDTCPEDLLPYLAYAFALKTWDPTWPVAIKRARIRAAIPIHKRKGTASSVRAVVESFGSGVAMREWFETDPPGTPMTFSITVAIGAGAPEDAGFQSEIMTAVDNAKRAAAQYELVAGVTASSAIGVVGGAQFLCYHRTRLAGSAAEAIANAEAGGGDPPPPPTPPVAAFTRTGTARVGQTQTFDASGSTGAGLSYAWAFGDGGTASGQTATHSYAAADDYTITLTVTDSAAQTSSVTKTLTIAAALPAPPGAAFSVSGNATAGDAQTFDASASTGTGLSYAWTFSDGGSASGQSADHTFANPGNYTVTLTVTDSAAQSDSVQHSLSIAAPLPAPPVAAFVTGGDPTAGQSVSFDASGSTGTGLSYAWDFGDGAAATGVSASHSYASAGSYTATLTVTDSAAQSDTATHALTIAAAAPAAPVAAFTVGGNATAGQSVSFDASGSTGTGLSYAWDFGDNATGAGSAPSHSYTSAGSYTVTLTVTDSASQTSQATHQLSIAAAPTDPVLQLFAATGAAGAYFNPADLTTMWQDSAATVPVTAADQPVRRIDDASGNGYSAIAPSDAARPMLRQDSNGWWLEFDGVDDWLDTGAPAVGATGLDSGPSDRFTVLIAVAGSSASNSTAVGRSTGSDGFYVYQNGASNPGFYFRGQYTGNNWGGFDGPPHIIGARWDGASALGWMDDTQSAGQVNGSVSPGAGTTITIGARAGAERATAGKIGPVVILDVAISAAQRANITAALMARQGVT